MDTSSSPSKASHLCVLIHGFWGNPNHLNELRETLQSQHSEDDLHILVAKSNADNLTYDGIEVGGERIVNEIEQTIRELEHDGAKITKLSMVGYSLGGLIARYAIGLLYKSGLFDNIEPVNFTTFATPHLGVRTPKLGYRSYMWNVMGARTLSTSGHQMFLIDNFRESGRPLLTILADPNSIFVKGLRSFKNKSLYVNTVNDRSVPFYTAGISRTDPYVDLEAIEVHYIPGQEDEVLLDPTNPVSRLDQRKIERLTASERLSLLSEQTRTVLPFYAMMFTLLPIFFPVFMVNSVYQTYRSAQRVRLHEAGQAGISLGRYRIPLLEEAQAVQERLYTRLAEQSGEDYLPTPPPERSQSPTSGSGSSEGKLEALAREESGKESLPFPILALTPEQFDMIDHLDAVGFEKFPAHILKHRHTHAAIVVRVQKPGFTEGKVVVRHWAKRFEL